MSDYEKGWLDCREAAAQVVVARGFQIPSLAKLADRIRALAPPSATASPHVCDYRCKEGHHAWPSPTLPLDPEAEKRCDDCRATGQPLITKGDHHGGTKTVCVDRDACHVRERAEKRCKTCGSRLVDIGKGGGWWCVTSGCVESAAP